MHRNNSLKIPQFNTSQKKTFFVGHILLQNMGLVVGLKLLYIDSNTKKRIKIRQLFGMRWQNSRIKDPKTIKITNVQFLRYCFYMSMY